MPAKIIHNKWFCELLSILCALLSVTKCILAGIRTQDLQPKTGILKTKVLRGPNFLRGVITRKILRFFGSPNFHFFRKNFSGHTRRRFFFGQARILFGVDAPEGPPTPFQCPHQTKKGTNLLLFNSVSIRILIKTWNWSVVELWAKTEIQTPMHYMTYQTTTTAMHSPKLLLFLQNSTDYLKLAQSWKLGVNCCSIGSTQPAACTEALVPLTFGHVHRPPFYPICLKSLAIDWAWAEDSNDMFKISWEWPRKKLETPQKLNHNGGTPPPLPDWTYTYQSKALNVRIPNM